MKAILQMYPSMPANSPEERARLRPIGRNVELYTQTVDGLVDIAKAADDLGYWGMSFIEHHLHSEGFEIGPNPGILNAWLGAHTKNLRLGQLGYVMSTQHPIRVAEETSILDHLLKGRFFVGFARGYQSRWVRTIGQPYEAQATVGQDDAAKAAADEHNARIFREMIMIVLKAWTEPSFSYDGEFFKVPFPYEGIDDYPAVPAAEKYGAPGEVGPDGRVHQVSVVPAPYQRPHPPVFISSSHTPASARWAGEMGFNCCYFAPLDIISTQDQAYREGAEAAGHPTKPGEKQGLLRFVIFGKTREEAYAKVERFIVPVFFDFYIHFFPRMFDRGGTTPLEKALRCGILIAGTVDDVRRQVEEVYKQLPFEYFSIVSHYALEPKEEFLEDIELFATKVMPEFS